MAHAPVVLQSYVALQQVIADYGTFDARTREAIALVVGNVDGCEYCQSAHTLSAKAAGLSSEQTVAIREDRVDFDPQLATLLTLVRQQPPTPATSRRHLAGRARRRLERHRTDRDLCPPGTEPVHQLLQPPGADRPGRSAGTRTVSRYRASEWWCCWPPRHEVSAAATGPQRAGPTGCSVRFGATTSS